MYVYIYIYTHNYTHNYTFRGAPEVPDATLAQGRTLRGTLQGHSTLMKGDTLPGDSTLVKGALGLGDTAFGAAGRLGASGTLGASATQREVSLTGTSSWVLGEAALII